MSLLRWSILRARAPRFAAAALAAVSAALALPQPGTASAHGLTLGFSSDPALTLGSATSRAPWIARAVSDGAQLVRVNVIWSEVAPAHRPRGFDPTDPVTRGYDWTNVDATVEQLRAAGLQVLINVWGAPVWAEGTHRPRRARPGSWRPNPRQFAAFATAAARRYSGATSDPLHPGAVLPRVRYWQAWNEPNLDYYLTPQWTRSGRRYLPASPAIYRSLLNAFYAAVKRVDRSNFVSTAGTAPYGDAPGGGRMQPVEFDRALFCLQGATALRPLRCPDPPHLDALAHHPYGIGGPLQHADNADDVAVPDIAKLARVLHAAERYGHVMPRGPKRLWVTEISWDSSPPDPQGVPVQTQARWYEQALYVLWRQGVDLVLLLQIVDSPPIPTYADSYQAGLYRLNGTAKPAALAYRFPFVTDRVGAGRLRAWGRAPTSGVLAIQHRRDGRWETVRRLSLMAGQVFAPTLRLTGGGQFRASQGGLTSLTWSQPR